MTDASVRIRDRFQLDVELSYPLPYEAARIEYELEAYFFIPPSLGINRDNYDKNNFYDDLDAHLQLMTPSVPLDAIVPSASGPLSRLNASVFRLMENADTTTSNAFVVQAKLFCCVVRKSLRDFVNKTITSHSLEERTRRCERFAISISSLRHAYRGLESRLRGAAMYPQVIDTFRFADEFLSIHFEDYTYRLLENAEAGGLELDLKTREKLLTIVREEIGYRRHRGFPSIAQDNSENESLLYRRSVLKRYVSSVLQLDTQTKPGGKIVQETLFGLAAGLSMLFTTVIIFVYQSIYGALSFPVFLALIVSYIFKDRIKELLRIYFSSKLSGVLSDHKTRIFGTFGNCLGECEETFDFVHEPKISREVMEVRSRDHMTEIEGTWVGERILRYRRSIRLYPEKIFDLYEKLEISEIADILRFNVRDIVKRTGTPEKPVFILADDSYHKSTGDRVHHLNLILRRRDTESPMCRRFRVVLNQRGIKRIDAVDTPSEEARSSPRHAAAV